MGLPHSRWSSLYSMHFADHLPVPGTVVLRQDTGPGSWHYISGGSQTRSYIISSRRSSHKGVRAQTEWGNLAQWSGLSCVSCRVTNHLSSHRTKEFLGLENIQMKTRKVLGKLEQAGYFSAGTSLGELQYITQLNPQNTLYS